MHWLTFSLEKQAIPEAGDGWSELKHASRFMRRQTRVHETGAQVFFDPSQERGVIDVPGNVCEEFGDFWVGELNRLRGRVTRVDLACDLEPADRARSRMLEMRRAFRAGRCETRIERIEEHRSYAEGDGFTWYFGGRGSELRLRAYDRRGPLRLEWCWRPVSSGEMLGELLQKQGPAPLWRMLSSKLLFPCAWYVELLKGPATSVKNIAREQPGYEKAAELIRHQYGVTLWALKLLGVPLESLCVEPKGKIDHHLAAKLMRWAREAGDRGHALAAAVRSLTRS